MVNIKLNSFSSTQTQTFYLAQTFINKNKKNIKTTCIELTFKTSTLTLNYYLTPHRPKHL